MYSKPRHLPTGKAARKKRRKIERRECAEAIRFSHLPAAEKLEQRRRGASW